MSLEIGDVTVSPSFVLRSADRRLSYTYKPPRGEEFVVLLLGSVKKGADVDVGQMLRDLGYHPATCGQGVR